MTEDYTLAHGTHATPQDGRCAMEWVSLLAGEPHSDAPTCVSPALRALCVTLNDGLPDAPRQRLRPYLARTIGTADDGRDELRGWLAVDWLVRVYTPAWLAAAGLVAAAENLRAGPAIHAEPGLIAGLPGLAAARGAARAERRRAFAAAGHPLGGRLAAVRGARIGREAAWTCAGAAAWAAARVGLDTPHAERARELVRAVAGDTAAIAVCRVDADDLCGAPSGRAARRAALGPTLEALADSAIALLDRMLPTEPLALPAISPGLAAAVSGTRPERITLAPA